MDILIVAAAIFGISSLVSRFHLDPLFAFPCVPDRVAATEPPAKINNRNSLLCAVKLHVYSTDRLRDLNRSSLPAPAPHVSSLLATNGILNEPLHHAPRRQKRLGPHRKTKRGTRGGRHRRIHTVTGHRPPPDSLSSFDYFLPSPDDHDSTPHVDSHVTDSCPTPSSDYVSSKLYYDSPGPNFDNLISVDCKNVTVENSTSLKCLYLNAQSCNNKYTEVNDLIVEKNADLVFITETWVKMMIKLLFLILFQTDLILFS